MHYFYDDFSVLQIVTTEQRYGNTPTLSAGG